MLPDKADAAGILFKLWIIEPLLDRDGSCPGRVLHWFNLRGLRGEDPISLVAHNQVDGPICLCWERVLWRRKRATGEGAAEL